MFQEIVDICCAHQVVATNHVPIPDLELDIVCDALFPRRKHKRECFIPLRVEFLLLNFGLVLLLAMRKRHGLMAQAEGVNP